MKSMKRQNDRILKEELPRSVGAQDATGDQWRNDSRENEETESHPQLGIVFAMAPSLHSFWSYFSTDLQ